jgi:hypothetical protein
LTFGLGAAIGCLKNQLEDKRIFNSIFSFFLSLQANGLASVGKYAAGSVVGAGADATLFVANHAY